MPGIKLTALRGVKMLGTARLGETVWLRAEVNARLGNLVQAAATATVGGTIVLQAEVTLAGSI